ncbi:MAG: hypothetical protein F6K24_01215 [Okeania sp. SIO2D1]|nr:hypothetical protein [Okeania sp. SIO2D1]
MKLLYTIVPIGYMKLNSTVALTLILLAMMSGAGAVSSLYGYTLGHSALKGHLSIKLIFALTNSC